MRRRRVGLAVGVIALVAPAMGAAGESAEVTIRVDSYFDRGSMSRKVRLSGNVASRAAGEVVEVLAKPCVVKNSFYRLVAAARTVSGGSWFLTNDDQVPRSGFFRARWRGKDSTPLLVRPPAYISAFWNLPRRRMASVFVGTDSTSYSLRGRFVVLQRYDGSHWVKVRRARLRRGPDPTSFTAVFVVRTRGLTLRVLLPAATAAPCFKPNVSKTWRS